MSKRYFKIQLGEGIEAHVYFETLNGLVISYVVKLLVWIGTEYYEVIRFEIAPTDALTKIFWILRGRLSERFGLSCWIINKVWTWP